MATPLVLQVVAKAVIGDTCCLTLADVQGRDLPPFTAGAHLDLHLPNGLIRQYSLCNSEAERHRYELGVLLAPDTRGGSRAVHGDLEIGNRVHVSMPRNQFPLVREAVHSILVGGGIGLTPLLSMAHALQTAGSSFELHHAVRSRTRGEWVTFGKSLPFEILAHPDDEPLAKLDLAKVLGDYRPGLHVYMCGPAGMLDAGLRTGADLGWPGEAVHFERFTPVVQTRNGDLPFDVRIGTSGRAIHVAANCTVLDALLDAGVDIPSSCEQGVCGTCRTGVLSGIPDHRDSFLTDDERAANDSFLPCCSRSRTAELVLDL